MTLNQKTEIEIFTKKEEWFKESENQTLETLPAFLEKLSKEEHDYSTICYAVAAAALGAAQAMNKSPVGGITGFQSRSVLWEFIRNWTLEKGPMKLVRYSNMIYPQYRENFEKIISKETMKYLQSEAKSVLDNEDKKFPINEDVRNHMQSIIDGKPPFGYTIKD